MKTRFPTTSLTIVLLLALFCSGARADQLAGVSDITMSGNNIVSIRYDGTEYVVANGDLILGTTTRWYIPAATGVPTLWEEGAPAPAATVAGSSDPKVADVGSKADNWTFGGSGSAGSISSIDGIDFQETIFPLPTKMIFVFERGGNDNGMVQGILADGSLGTPLNLTANGAPYANTGVDADGQNAFGYVFIADAPVMGLRITAPGHDALSVSAVPIRLDPKQSRDPQPKNEATDVPRDSVLAWMPGEGAVTRDVYLGTSLEDVENASRTDPRDVLVSQGQTAVDFETDSLEFGGTYYWRVDEITAEPGAAPFKGEVWSFTIEPYAYPIRNITATASSAKDDNGPENTVNGSGLNPQDQHSTDETHMWVSLGDQPSWIQYEFDQVYKLHELWVWNYNHGFESFVGWGAKEVKIEYSVDGETWAELQDVPEFAQAPGQSTYTYNTTVPFGGVFARFVKLTITDNWGTMAQTGLSEVRFFRVPVQAREPVPADGATGVAVDTDLVWRPGREAQSHQVYFGKNADAVAAGTVTAVNRTQRKYTPPSLDLLTTYYWRVDEVGETGTFEGDLWSFTTQEFLVVEDFESYNDKDKRIYEAWIDGEKNNTGATVGYMESVQGTFGERTIVRGGTQSMPLFYDNAGKTMAEAQYSFDAQDWTANGIRGLSLYFHGEADNTGQLYVKINNTKVVYNGDAADIKQAAWQVWNIDLSAVAGNLTRVTQLTIGIEGPGVSGVLYIDDIRLLPASLLFSTAITIGPAQSVEATGNDGTILSINGIAVADLVLGTTTSDFEQHPAHPAADADNFELGVYASLDNSNVITVMFPVPVTTVFIVERGANDSGFIRPLDAAGLPIGEAQPFVTATWFRPGLTIEGQAAGAIVITANSPIWGIMLLPPTGGVTGIDPASISAVPAE
jgi:hypothetical protein